MLRSRIGRIYTAQAISNGYRLLIARFQLSNSMLESGQTTQCDYPENSGFGRSTEREWGSRAATLPPEKENQPMRIYIIGHDGITVLRRAAGGSQRGRNCRRLERGTARSRA